MVFILITTILTKWLHQKLSVVQLQKKQHVHEKEMQQQKLQQVKKRQQNVDVVHLQRNVVQQNVEVIHLQQNVDVVHLQRNVVHQNVDVVHLQRDVVQQKDPHEKLVVKEKL